MRLASLSGGLDLPSVFSTAFVTVEDILVIVDGAASGKAGALVSEGRPKAPLTLLQPSAHSATLR